MDDNTALFTIGIIGITGFLVICSALVTGFLVLKAKREAHEPVFGYKKSASRGKPINIDDMAGPDDQQGPDDALPESVALQNKIFGSMFAKDNLKGER